MLEIKNLRTSYGHILALENVSISVEEGKIVSIIGSNGAGKTTLLNTISGIVKPSNGSIKFLGQTLHRMPHQVVKAGLVHVPEGRKVFSGLTVQENLLMGGYLVKGKQLDKNLEWIYSLFTRLKERSKQYAGTLSGGEQQMLAIGRGLMSNPKMMLLDEPSLGLAPLITNDVFKLIKQIRNNNITVLLVEQNAKKALALSDYAYVLENGRIVMSGDGDSLLDDPNVKSAYLGEASLSAGN